MCFLILYVCVCVCVGVGVGVDVLRVLDYSFYSDQGIIIYLFLCFKYGKIYSMFDFCFILFLLLILLIAYNLFSC